MVLNFFLSFRDKDKFNIRFGLNFRGFIMSPQKSLNNVFESLMSDNRIFQNKEVLRHSYTPQELPHRDKEIQSIAQVLVSVLRGETPSNMFIYGKTGTGKTITVDYVTNQMKEKSKEYNTDVDVIYLNCRVVDTQYRVLSKLAQYYGENVPSTGWPTDEVYETFLNNLDKEERYLVVVLDEIDQLIKKSGDDILYNLSRINSSLDNSNVSIVGISNDLKVKEEFDSRVISSLGEEEIIFPPYDAVQLKDILEKRTDKAFADDSIDDGVIPLCSALAAREHGDARKALDLLRVSGEIVENKGESKIEQDHVWEAKDKIERDRISEAIKTLPTQSKLVLYSIIALKDVKEKIHTGDVYEVYKDLAEKVEIDQLTQRRVTDLISELDMLGLINARVVSRGRYGRSKEMNLAVPADQARNILESDYKLSSLTGYSISKNSKLTNSR